jgi:hypothetical protein
MTTPKHETPRAKMAFRLYAELGIGRSHRKVAERIADQELMERASIRPDGGKGGMTSVSTRTGCRY